MSTELVKPATGFQIDKERVPFDKFVEITLKSGAYKDVKTPYELIMKVVYGQALGLDPATSLSSIHLIQGKPTMSATLMAGRVKQYGGGKYRYEIVEKTDKKCTLRFYELIEDWTKDGKQFKRWVEHTPETFTIEMAKAAGLDKNDNWKKYPSNMLFARCMSNGVKTYCPEVLSGLPIYTPDELDPSVQYQLAGDDLVPVQAAVKQVDLQPVDQKPAPVKVVAAAYTDLGVELRRLLKETKTEEKAFLSQQFEGDTVEKLTVPEMEQAIKVLKMKLAAPKAAQPTV